MSVELSYSMKTTLKKNFLLGVGVTNETSTKILEYILLGLSKKGERYYIVTPNPEILVHATTHSGFKTILNNARLALCDGVGVFWAGKFLGKSFVARTTGVELLETLCREAAEKPITVGFLGGKPGVAEKTAECLLAQHPGLKIVFVGLGWSDSRSVQKEKYQVVSIKYQVGIKKEKKLNTQYLIPNTPIDILFVAYGFPKQEEWMADNLDKNIYRVAMGVGGAFDYISGNVPRAPVFVRKLGLEWLFRLFLQPWRIKRQFSLLKFIGLVIREKQGVNK